MAALQPESAGSQKTDRAFEKGAAAGAPGRAGRAILRLLISAGLLIPCFWHAHIQAGDLGSHTYNAWLAQLIKQGNAPGLYLVWQWQNVLFDLLLFYAVKLAGFGLGEKLAVSVCVLIFFWGVFTLLRAATERPPWLLTPLLAMLSYCYVFHMGFMNYYLSLGLGSLALALVWNGKRRGIVIAALLTPFVMLAHPLGVLWFAGVAAYRFVWLRVVGWPRLTLPLVVASALWSVRWYLQQHPRYEADWAEKPLYQWNGSDQLRIFGDAYNQLAWAVVLAGLIFIAWELWQLGREEGYWKERRLIVELYVVSICAVTLLPEDLRPEAGGSWIGGLATRLTLVCAIFAGCFLASLRPRICHLLAFGVCAGIFFIMVHRDTGFLDRLEKNAEAITQQLPFGTRVASTVFSPPSYRPQYEHLVDRACIGHCFLYSNYEPSTGKFRVRVRREGSRLVASVVDESEDLQFGNYDVEDNDLPMKQIYQCDATDLSKLCIRDLESGEENGRLGYRPR